jgi:cobalt-precorrin 5A hydrolase
MKNAIDIGIWQVRAESDAIADRLYQQFGGTIYRPWLNASLPQRQQFAVAYRRHAFWIVIAASGIVVRFLEGLPKDKTRDPAVVVVDEAARHAISLLGGHEGGANKLAYRVANLLGAVPVVTTATEVLKPLVLGIGCRKDVDVEQIRAAVSNALGALSLSDVREVATIDVKANEPGLLAFCESHDLPLRVIATETIAARAWVTQPSEWVKQNVGVDGVCEPCALIAAARGRLIVPKTALNGVAVAVVEDI